MSKNEVMKVVKLSGRLDVSDILSVVTSRAETKFHGELDTAKVLIVEAEATATKLDKDASAMYKAECRTLADGVAKKLRPAVESVGGTVTISSKNEWDVKTRDRNSDGLLSQDVKVRSNCDRCGRSEVCFTATGEPSKALLALEESAKEAWKVVTVRQTEALTWRKKLANVPMLERRARAKIAETKLSESDDGQQLLDLLTDDLEAELLALPAS